MMMTIIQIENYISDIVILKICLVMSHECEHLISMTKLV